MFCTGQFESAQALLWRNVYHFSLTHALCNCGGCFAFLWARRAAALSTERSEAAYLMRAWSRAAIDTTHTLLTGSHRLPSPPLPSAAFHENIAFFCESKSKVQLESSVMLNNWCVRVNPSTTSELARAKPRMCSDRGFARASLSPDPGVLPCLVAGQIGIYVCDMITNDTNNYDTSCVLVGVRAHRAQSTQCTSQGTRSSRVQHRAHHG